MKVFSVHTLSYLSRNVAWTQSPLTPLVQEPPHPREHPLGLCAGARHTLVSLANVGYSSFLALRQSEFLSASKGSFDDGLIMFGGLKRKNQRERESGSLMLKCFLCLMSKLFRFGLFQQLRVPSEYQALPSE